MKIYELQTREYAAYMPVLFFVNMLWFARTMIAAGAAALTSRATGGDVLQGALTGATVHLFNGEEHIAKKRGRGQMGKQQLNPRTERVYSLSAEAGIPAAGLAGRAMDTVVPTGLEYEVGVLQGADNSAQFISDPAVSFDAGLGGIHSVAAFDVKAPDTNATINLIFGVGVRIHFNHEGVSGFGVGVGTSFSKTRWIPSAWKKADFSGSTSVSFDDL